MKTMRINTPILLCFLLTFSVSAQEVAGRLYVSGLNTTTTWKEKAPADLYRDFKEDTYIIQYKAEGRGKDSRTTDRVTLKSTVRFNGEIIAQSLRKDYAIRATDSRIPVEAFDFIPALQEFSQKRTSGIPSGVDTETRAARGTPTVGFDKKTGSLALQDTPTVPFDKKTGTLAARGTPTVVFDKKTGTLAAQDTPTVGFDQKIADPSGDSGGPMSLLPKGNYSILLEISPSELTTKKARIAPATINFTIE